MPWWLQSLVGLAAAMIVGWLVLLISLARTRPSGGTVRDAVRILPDTLRLVTALARDRDLPRGIRTRLWLLLAYLASPIDLVPDFIPVVGYADDVVMIGWVLRSVIRRAGVQAVSHHWRGTSAGLAVLLRLTGSGKGRSKSG